MGAQGTTEIDFGAWPGADQATVAVTGQAGIIAGSLVEAWIRLTATTDHSIDEHLYDPPLVMAGNIVAGTGFTIYGQSQMPPEPTPDSINGGKGVGVPKVITTPRPYGKWTVAWVWN